MSLRTFFGAVLVVVGAGFLLDQFGVVEFGPLFSTWWPLLIVLVGVLQLATRSVPVVAGVVVVVFGALLQLQQLDYLDVNVWSLFWPAMLIIFGVNLLFRSGAREAAVSSQGRLSEFVIFGGTNRRIAASPFEGGSVTTLFGGSEIDLRGSTLTPEGTSVDLTTAFGGIKVFVPSEWGVKVSGLPLFGGWDNKVGEPTDPNQPTLTVRAMAAFGGIEITT